MRDRICGSPGALRACLVVIACVALFRTPALARGLSANKPYQSPRWKESGDSDSDENISKTYSPLPGSRVGAKSSSSSASPRRVERFWSHYHGAREEKKEKPLEREAR